MWLHARSLLTKVTKLHKSISIDKNITGLEIPMDNLKGRKNNMFSREN